MRGGAWLYSYIPIDILWLKSFVGIGMVMKLASQIANFGASNILLSISGSSYIIYLFHTTFEGFAKAILYKIPLFNSESEFVFSMCTVFIVFSGVVGPMLLHRFVLCKWKLTRVLFGLK